MKNRYKPNSIYEMRKLLSIINLPDKAKIEVGFGVSLNVKTVDDLRQLRRWHPEWVVDVHKDGEAPVYTVTIERHVG